VSSDPGYLDEVLQFAGLLGVGSAAQIQLTPLSGGVSSDVWKVAGPLGTACIKRALPTLRVARRWDVPVERSEYEYRWLVTAHAIVPSAVPLVLNYQPHTHLIGMQYFPPDAFPNWRIELLEGRIEGSFAAELGHTLGRVHAATAGDTAIRERFGSDDLFDALRLDPYFRSLRSQHTALVHRLDSIIQTTATTRRVLVHGDVSPKNILVGKKGPIVLDAECAWYGDPAFDVAFTCTHLLLKMCMLPDRMSSLGECFARYTGAYESHVHWEPLHELRVRCADLLGAMLLARIDGKSPVDYLPEAAREWVRKFALEMLARETRSPNQICEEWIGRLSRDFCAA
jgi:5-methylthioribose kinase